MRHNVFVYGTLMQGFGNHYVLGDSFFCGDIDTKYLEFKMYGFYVPAAVQMPTDEYKKIRGQLYSVNNNTLKRLDYLEGHPHNYKRRLVQLEDDQKALMYLMDERYAWQFGPCLDTTTDVLSYRELREAF